MEMMMSICLLGHWKMISRNFRGYLYLIFSLWWWEVMCVTLVCGSCPGYHNVTWRRKGERESWVVSCNMRSVWFGQLWCDFFFLFCQSWDVLCLWHDMVMVIQFLSPDMFELCAPASFHMFRLYSWCGYLWDIMSHRRISWKSERWISCLTIMTIVLFSWYDVEWSFNWMLMTSMYLLFYWWCDCDSCWCDYLWMVSSCDPLITLIIFILLMLPLDKKKWWGQMGCWWWAHLNCHFVYPVCTFFYVHTSSHVCNACDDISHHESAAAWVV